MKNNWDSQSFKVQGKHLLESVNGRNEQKEETERSGRTHKIQNRHSSPSSHNPYNAQQNSNRSIS